MKNIKCRNCNNDMIEPISFYLNEIVYTRIAPWLIELTQYGVPLGRVRCVQCYSEYKHQKYLKENPVL